MQLVWTRPSQNDLFDIADFYAEHDQRIAIRILEHIYEAPLVLLDHPRLGAITRRRGVRKWSVKRTPFILLYVVRKDAVEIRRVIHGATDWNPRGT